MNQTWERRDCVSAEVDGSLVLLDLETLAYHSLNSTAAAVWELLETPQSESGLVGSLCERYKVDAEQCAASVHVLLETLAQSKLVKLAYASAGTPA